MKGGELFIQCFTIQADQFLRIELHIECPDILIQASQLLFIICNQGSIEFLVECPSSLIQSRPAPRPPQLRRKYSLHLGSPPEAYTLHLQGVEPVFECPGFLQVGQLLFFVCDQGCIRFAIECPGILIQASQLLCIEFHIGCPGFFIQAGQLLLLLVYHHGGVESLTECPGFIIEGG
ncbi:hypothetical protein RQP46_007405 [Phenoliferia psychrophenolica]